MKKLVLALLLVCLVATFVGCSPKTVERSGVYVTNDLDGAEETQYVICVSKNVEDGEKLIKTVNEVIKEVDVKDIAVKYSDYKNRRSFKTLESYMYNLNDNTDGDLHVMSATLEPFNYSGAGGAYTDGIDAYLMLHVAEKLNKKLITYDRVYSYCYNEVKAGKAEIFATGIANTAELKNDFLVSDVYLTGRQQIISDKNEGYTKLSDLKGKTIGVLKGRIGATLVKEAIENGVLKNSGATMVEYETDTECESMLHTEMCDVLVIDELPAKLIIAKAA